MFRRVLIAGAVGLVAGFAAEDVFGKYFTRPMRGLPMRDRLTLYRLMTRGLP